MKPPIVVIDDEDLLIFDSVEGAERYLEPIDVQEGPVEILDADGQPIRARVESQNTWLGPQERVKLEPVAGAAANEARLREVVLIYVCRLGMKPGIDLPLASLLAMAPGTV